MYVHVLLYLYIYTYIYKLLASTTRGMLGKLNPFEAEKLVHAARPNTLRAQDSSTYVLFPGLACGLIQGFKNSGLCMTELGPAVGARNHGSHMILPSPTS